MSRMTRRGFIWSASALGLALPTGAALEPSKHDGWAEPSRTYAKLDPLAEWDAQLGFALDPPVESWQPQRSQRPRQVLYAGSGYRLKINFTFPEPGLASLEFHLEREDGNAFTVRSYSLKARQIFTDIHDFWDYRAGSSEILGEFDVYTRGLASEGEYQQIYAANTGIPLALCANRAGHNRFSFGLLDQVEVTGLAISSYSLGISKRGEGLNYQFEFVKPVGYALKRSKLSDGAYVDARDRTWFHTLEQYTSWVEHPTNLKILKPPPKAFEPVWNTWYPFGFNITQESVWKNAELCKKVGLKNLLIDSGYQNQLTSGLGSKKEQEMFADYTGDWTPNRKKFPDFRGLVERIHGLGQLVTVWVALFMLGKRTPAYPEVRDLLIHDAEGKETNFLCACAPGTPAYLARTFSKLARDYDLDGFWLDFMDGMHRPCHNPHTHFTDSPGEGYNRCLAAVRDAVLKFKPDFLIETRMKMANINAKQFVNVLETIDMPFDFDLNRSLGVVVRSFARGSAPKIDPVQWHIRELDENVSTCCATLTLTGVPVFGVDFRLLPESHLRVVAAWMKFYREHRNDLWSARFDPVAFGHLSPLLRIHGKTKTFLYVGSASTAPCNVRGSREIYLINASDQPRLTIFLDEMGTGPWQAILRNCYHEPVSTVAIGVKSRTLAFDHKVPKGGLVELRKNP